MPCPLSVELWQDATRPSYVCRGAHPADYLVLGVSEVVTSVRMPPGCCDEFRRAVLALFGPGGSRRVESPRQNADEFGEFYDTTPDGRRVRPELPPLPLEPNDGFGFEPWSGLGRKPHSRVDDE